MEELVMNITDFLKRTSVLGRMLFLAVFASVVLGGYQVYAEQEVVSAGVAHSTFVANNVWMLLATFLVFIMHLGFASLESGLTRSKNTINILFKNTFIIAVGIVTYALMGFNLMYPGDFSLGGIFGFAGFGLSAPQGADGLINYADGGYTYHTDFIFQAMFAATAATIVSGAVAERVKISSFLIFATILVAVIYPVAGSWKWGGGWLDQMGFLRFRRFYARSQRRRMGRPCRSVSSRSTFRESISASGAMRPIPGHSLPLLAIGVFLLWLGWFGFNGGSVLSADPELISLVIVTTSPGGSGGRFGSGFHVVGNFISTLTSTMALNGVLAGLVGITAGADVVSPAEAVLIGLAAGVIVVLAISFLDRIKIDDPVGAIPVHLVCGIWGTLAVGILGGPDFSILTQFIGIAAYGVFTVVCSFIVFYALKITIGIRVDEDDEIKGLDIREHGMEAYPDFQAISEA